MNKLISVLPEIAFVLTLAVYLLGLVHSATITLLLLGLLVVLAKESSRAIMLGVSFGFAVGFIAGLSQPAMFVTLNTIAAIVMTAQKLLFKV
jgi:hypothetical protein